MFFVLLNICCSFQGKIMLYCWYLTLCRVCVCVCVCIYIHMSISMCAYNGLCLSVHFSNKLLLQFMLIFSCHTQHNGQQTTVHLLIRNYFFMSFLFLFMASVRFKQDLISYCVSSWMSTNLSSSSNTRIVAIIARKPCCRKETARCRRCSFG